MQEKIDIISCVLLLHMIKKPAYEYYKISIGDRLIPKHVTTESLEALGSTLNLIDIWLKLLDENYEARSVAYRTDTKNMFKQITTTTKKPLIQRRKVQKFMTKIGGGWYMKKITKGLPTLMIPKLSKKAQENKDEIKKLYESNRY